MNLQNKKCVLVLDEDLPLGILANTAAVLATTIGKECPDIIGPTITDQDNNSHLGIVAIPIPILKGNRNLIQELRTTCYREDYDDCIIVDFSNVAQKCKNYDDYTSNLLETPTSDIHYYGIGICGDKKKVNKLTGSLPLLR